MGRENYEDFVAAIHNPATVHAMLEDYRAGLGIDRRHDEADRRSGKAVTCPTLVLLTTREDDADLYPDVHHIWRSWASELRVQNIDSDHHMAEEAPERLARVVQSFLVDAM